jgi:cyclopropane fatty-acyl-phospholipid synthase-like methyltransferase
MANPPTFHDRYQQDETPWEIHRVDHNLVQFIRNSGLAPCTVLDAGCGTGSNSIWLAQQGFTVSGWDFVEQAVNRAREKGAAAGTSCAFARVDFLEMTPVDGVFDFIFDRGLFHCFKSSNQLHEIARVMAALLPENGTWLSLIGNADEIRQEQGPPQLSAQQITAVVEPLFIIESITASFFDSDQQPPAKNWVCHMRKR